MIKLVVFDFDGVFSDGKFYFDSEGTCTRKSYHARDAMALRLLQDAGMKTAIISHDESVDVRNSFHLAGRLNYLSAGKQGSKLKILNEWLKEEPEIGYENVAYIGDDLADLEILRVCGLSACPADALEQLLESVDYVCKHTSGNGAVREFTEHILFVNRPLVAMIPVRAGSTRCKNKNIRDFSDTNLLQLKIQTLKEVRGISEIIVSSDSPEMLAIAKAENVTACERSRDGCNTYDVKNFMKNLSQKIGRNKFMLYVHVTTPLISVEVYNDIITTWYDVVKKGYDSLVTVTNIKEFTFFHGQSLNYDSLNPIPSQSLPNDLHKLNFGCHILDNNTIAGLNIGKRPYFYETDGSMSTDIDYNSDFLQAELQYNEDLISEEICDNVMKSRGEVEILDCTLRDGGYLTNWDFSEQYVIDCYKAVTEAGVSYFEIGFRSNYDLIPNKGMWCYSTEEAINSIYEQYQGCKLAVMAKVGTVTIDDFVPCEQSHVSLVRVQLSRLTAEKISLYDMESLLEAKKLSMELIGYGYDVTFNVACGDLITQPEFELIGKVFQDVPLKAFYLADTFGGFDDKIVAKQLHLCQKNMTHYKFGFHAHNNRQDALSKTKKAIFHGCTIIDTCIGGLGRGAGNLPLELFICHDPSRLSAIVDFYIVHDMSKLSDLYYYLAGHLSVHPDYILEILDTLPLNENHVGLILKINKKYYDTNLIKSFRA